MAGFTNLAQWLASISLSQYEPNLKSNGFDDAISVGELTDADLQQIGISMLGHRKKLLAEATKLKTGGPQAVSNAPATAATAPPAAAAAAMASPLAPATSPAYTPADPIAASKNMKMSLAARSDIVKGAKKLAAETARLQKNMAPGYYFSIDYERFYNGCLIPYKTSEKWKDGESRSLVGGSGLDPVDVAGTVGGMFHDPTGDDDLCAGFNNCWERYVNPNVENAEMIREAFLAKTPSKCIRFEWDEKWTKPYEGCDSIHLEFHNGALIVWVKGFFNLGSNGYCGDLWRVISKAL